MDSERRRSSDRPLDGLPPDTRKPALSLKERLAAKLERAQRLKDWYRKLARRHPKSAKNLEGQIVDLENIEFTPEEEAEIAAAKAESDKRLNLGQRCDLDCALSQEKLMAGVNALVRSEEVDCEVDRDMLPRGSMIQQQFFEERERICFYFAVSRLDIHVEKLAIQTHNGPQLVAASVEDIGPPKSKITWNFLSNMAILVGQYAMPLNRFAGLVSSQTKQFTAAEMSRHFRYVATRLEPIYLHFVSDLANSAVLAGDDTTSRVLEVTKALQQADAGSKAEPPWAGFATPDKAAAALKKGDEKCMAHRLAARLGFEFERKDGKGQKRRFNTTVLSGRSNPFDPRSQIVFFRSHLGGLGDLLDQILQSRNTDYRELVIQSDLSTTNLISNPELRNRFNINYAGCASHARRPFAIYEDLDPDLCAWILHSFKGLAIYEQGLDIAGRNRENIEAIRDIDERETWDDIKTAATMLAEKWPSKTDLGEAARYIIKNFAALTYYLRDHRLTPSNNFSERMLRTEKLIENNALFRKTFDGHFALDIVRSVLQTGIAAQVDLQLYLNWLLRMPHDAVIADPAEFTPLAFAELNAQKI